MSLAGSVVGSVMGSEYRPGASARSEPPLGLRDVSARPKSAGDCAQARLFDDILQREMAELQRLADAIEERGAGRQEQRYGRELRQVHTQINEVRRLLDALRDRFQAG